MEDLVVIGLGTYLDVMIFNNTVIALGSAVLAIIVFIRRGK